MVGQARGVALFSLVSLLGLTTCTPKGPPRVDEVDHDPDARAVRRGGGAARIGALRRRLRRPERRDEAGRGGLAALQPADASSRDGRRRERAPRAHLGRPWCVARGGLALAGDERAHVRAEGPATRGHRVRGDGPRGHALARRRRPRRRTTRFASRRCVPERRAPRAPRRATTSSCRRRRSRCDAISRSTRGRSSARPPCGSAPEPRRGRPALHAARPDAGNPKLVRLTPAAPLPLATSVRDDVRREPQGTRGPAADGRGPKSFKMSTLRPPAREQGELRGRGLADEVPGQHLARDRSRERRPVRGAEEPSSHRAGGEAGVGLRRGPRRSPRRSSMHRSTSVRAPTTAWSSPRACTTATGRRSRVTSPCRST